MGCGSSVADKRALEECSQKSTAVELFDPSNNSSDAHESEILIATIIEWEWTASGSRRGPSIEGNSERFKEVESKLQQIRFNNMNTRAAGIPLEPIIELEDFEDRDFNRVAT
jgi:hypothetical protein